MTAVRVHVEAEKRSILARRFVAVVALLLGAHAAVAGWYARRATATVDEFADLPAGLLGWRRGDFSLDVRNPPLMKLAVALPAHLGGAELPAPGWRRPGVGWWPWVHGERFYRLNRAGYDRWVLAGRLVVLAASLGCGALVAVTARRRHGPAGGVLALAAWCLTPGVLAHGSLATTDMGAAALFFAASVALDRHLASRSWPALAVSGALAGLALAAKFSAVVWFPAAAMALAVGAAGGAGRRLRGLFGRLAVLAVLAAAAVQLAYGVPGACRAGALELRSGAGAFLREHLGWLPLPVPREFVLGFDDALAYARNPELPGYLGGEWSKRGWWYYVPLAFVLKEPLALLALAAWAALRLRPQALRSAPALVLPPLVLLAVLVGFNRVQYGLRYLLGAYPFLMVGIGGLAPHAGRAGRAAIAALVVALAGESLGSRDHPLARFNLLAGGPAGGYRWLADSNLDWGQDLGELARLLARRWPGRTVKLAYFGHVDPAHYGIRYEVLRGRDDAAGLVAVSASYLAGLPYAITWRGFPPEAVPGGTYTWLSGTRPAAHAGHSIYVYELP